MLYDVFLKKFFSLFTPSTPMMDSPPYWNVLASPNSTTQRMPLASAEMGSAICANDKM